MDFIVKLPRSRGCDSIWVVADRMLKEAHFVPTVETISAPDLAFLFLHHIFRLHGLPQSIVSDRGSVFISNFLTHLIHLLGIKMKTSTAYHPQTDGQTERINQMLEKFLRCFCSYNQDDWVDYLPIAEYAYNNAKSSSTQLSPFFASKGYHPSFEPTFSPSVTTVPAAADFAKRLAILQEEVRAELKHAQEDQARFYNRKVLPAPPFEVGDKVWLLRRNIKTKRPSFKLDHRRLGPFTIIKKVGSSFQLDLPPSLSRLHPVFHVNLLEPYHSPDTIDGRSVPPPPPVQLDEESGESWHEVETILDVRKVGRRFDYLVHWKGFTADEDSWVPLQDMSTNLDEDILCFHRRHPSKPRPHTLELNPSHPPVSLLDPPLPSPETSSIPIIIDPSTADSLPVADPLPPHLAPYSAPIPNLSKSINPRDKHLSYIPPPVTTTRSGRKSRPRDKDLDAAPLGSRPKKGALS